MTARTSCHTRRAASARPVRAPASTAYCSDSKGNRLPPWVTPRATPAAVSGRKPSDTAASDTTSRCSVDGEDRDQHEEDGGLADAEPDAERSEPLGAVLADDVRREETVWTARATTLPMRTRPSSAPSSP